ncbi:hypothetical protein VitviT2T_000311 [Vitis vinifera]|uniref:Protein kinase domain-containing protein n=4 Tax=Vitis vinifera TaxID=29760 RepID=A0ABY9BC79_VITVI|nr:rust resistance kinase Lr10-like [Vitis vinifera]WJZ80385.1 hypothetical protein VitviT2T_000311 [Vitis vinifera]|eukprot:XP_002279652.2 PREDICTED: rust resistance kinase Lr10-like isoform X3 [Vitis vinifera]
MVPMLLLLNWGFRMGSVSFLVLFLLSHSVLLSSAEEERKHPPTCPPFDCEKLGRLHFPFKNETNSECGLCTIVRCTEELPRIQLERGGRYFGLKNISQADTIVIQDERLQEHLQRGICEFIDNLTRFRSPSVSFKPVPPLAELTLFKCHRNLNIDLTTDHTYTGCQDYIIHYNHPNHTSLLPPLPHNQPNHTPTLPAPPPLDCSIIQYPINMSLGMDNLVALLTSDITLEVHLSRECRKCHFSGGQCRDDEGKFRCAHTGNDKTLKLALGLAISITGIGIPLALTFYFSKKFRSIFKEKQTGNHLNVETFLRNHESLAPKRYRYSEVQKMTSSFKDRVGEGGYGAVYKGKLLNGDLVAVKVLSETKGNGEEFINEIASISRTSHVNIVSLLGFCFQGSKRALIYEFMPNGSLEKFIYDKNSSMTYDKLGWETLYNIAIGIARGLEYLHRGCNTRILHLDIKPHNILLNQDFCPKISDFGLSKLCTRKESIVSMSGARGTAGYIAPEVFCRNFGDVSPKSDVYSYGMMVLEMVGGRKNIDDGINHTSEIYFPHWIYKRLELDEELGLQGFMNEEERTSARKMIIVSLWCIQTNPSNRPPMNGVVDMLEGSLESLQIPPKPFLYSPPRSMRDLSIASVS